MEQLRNNTENENTIAELPKSSADDMTRFYLRELESSGKAGDVLDYINQQLNGEGRQYDSADEFLADNPDYFARCDEDISDEGKEALRDYSSYNFAWINTVERGFWDYEKLGRKTPEREAEIRQTSDRIDKAISAAPAPKEDFVTYRGTDLSGFSKFGVHSLEELEQMKGQMMVESGYTSTALKRENSFVENESTLWIGESNIEMHYHIPAGKKTSVAMLNNRLSHSPNQTEVLLNRGMMSYISDVNYDKPGHAVVEAIVIPFELYDPNRIQ